MIDSFSGEYRFLSNFYPAEVQLDGPTYKSTEHAFQAAKTDNPTARRRIREAPSPADAKRQGKLVQLRPDWEQVKVGIMEGLLRQKFAIPELREKLLETGDQELVEGNTWGDKTWGKVNGVGQNYLGKLLMKIRAEIKASQ